MKEKAKAQNSRTIFSIKRAILRTDCSSLGEFVNRYARLVQGELLLLPRPNMFPPGTEIELEFHLADNHPVLRGKAKVEATPPGTEGTAIIFTELDAVSRGVLRQLTERANLQAPAVVSGRQAIEAMLSQIRLVSEKFEEVEAVRSTAASPKGPVLGIDLGTTNSCCALVKDGRPFVIPSRRGHATVPSVVAVDPMGNIIVGHAARAQMEINPSRTVYGAKRLVGRPFESPVVREVRDRFHYQIVPGPEGRAAVCLDGKVYSLEKISSLILEEIRNVAQEYLGKLVMRAVVTVPAYYNENQREAVRAAGAMAGLHVERILNEPTAAALAYGMGRAKNQRLLVFDLGGGTFDATVMQVAGNRFEVLATGGDTFLGGIDFDTQLMDHIIIEFQLQLGRLPEIDRVALLRALQAAEFAKCTLSAREQARVQLPFIGKLDGKPVDLDITVTRQQLEQLVRPLVERTLKVCDEVLNCAGLGKEQLDAILLVGGQTRMPLIWKMIEEHFGKPPLKGVHPDESVAVGAALLADSLERVASVMLVDVLPMSIGLGIPGGKFIPLIKAGTRVPVERTFALTNFYDNQTEMLLPVYQGESEMVDNNEYLGTIQIHGIPPGPPGSRTIEVTFRLSPECLLTVSAADREKGRLSEVLMTTRDTPDSLKKKLGLDEAGLAPTTAAHKQAPAPAQSSATKPEAAKVTPNAPPSQPSCQKALAQPAAEEPAPQLPEQPSGEENASPISPEQAPGLLARIFRKIFRR